MESLNDVSSAFDRIADQNGIERTKTLGDGYMAVGGAPVRESDIDHTTAVAEMAPEMREWLAERSIGAGWNLRPRIGLDRGPDVGAIIGTTQFMSDLWGDIVNIASRMESSGEPDEIQVTEAVVEHLGEM